MVWQGKDNIFPFNYIFLKDGGDIGYSLYVFNGTSFDSYKSGRSKDGNVEIKLPISVDNAYRFVLSFNSKIKRDVKIEVSLI